MELLVDQHCGGVVDAISDISLNISRIVDLMTQVVAMFVVQIHGD